MRQDFARHYDNVARMDRQVGDILAMLAADGVADDTIIFFFADNGRGFPRDKRWIYDGGIHMPLIIRWPSALEPGSVDDQLISYVDLAPTVLALAGVDIPAHLHGRAFLGRNARPEPDYVFAAEDRHDEAADRIRAVRDRRFKYIRNYQPDTPYGQTVRFRNNLATMQEIFRLHDEGTLTAPADWYYRSTKPVEELYDTSVDPDELTNLAEREEYRAVLERMRRAHSRWVEETGDRGAIPEDELAEGFWPGGVQPPHACAAAHATRRIIRDTDSGDAHHARARCVDRLHLRRRTLTGTLAPLLGPDRDRRIHDAPRPRRPLRVGGER